MILGLDVSTSITGATILDKDGKVVYNDAWDLRKYKNFFQKADYVESQIKNIKQKIDKVFIEQSLQSLDPGFLLRKLFQLLVNLMALCHGCRIKYSRWSLSS